MTDKLKLTNRLMNIRDKAKVFHSSGYAQSQSGSEFGAASTESFGKRRAIDENRKFVQKYNNARVINDARAFERVREYIPRTSHRNLADTSAANGGVNTETGGRGSRVDIATGASATQRATSTVQPPARRVMPIRRGR